MDFDAPEINSNTEPGTYTYIHTYIIHTYIHTYIHENNPNKNNIETVVCSGVCVCMRVVKKTVVMPVRVLQVLCMSMRMKDTVGK